MPAKTALITAPLGTTGLDITRVGLGTWAIGGGTWAFGWGTQDDDDSVRAICEAVESGINWVDTAPVYGLGHSEEVVGRALAAFPAHDRPYVFTKAGLLWDPLDRKKPPRREVNPRSLRIEVEESLRRLDVDQLDLYQVHWPTDDGTPVEEYWAEMVALRESGKVAAVGLSNHDVPALEFAEAVGHVDTLQPAFSPVRREAAPALLAWCQEHDTGVIAYSPMQAGLLTGGFTSDRARGLPADDWRSADPEFNGSRLVANLEVADALAAVAARHDVTPAAVSVAWVLAFPGITGAIVGARRVGQVAGWVEAGSLVLTAEDFDDIAATLQRTGAGGGPVRPDRLAPVGE